MLEPWRCGICGIFSTDKYAVCACGISMHPGCASVCRGCGALRNTECLYVDGCCGNGCRDDPNEAVKCSDCGAWGPRDKLTRHKELAHAR